MTVTEKSFYNRILRRIVPVVVVSFLIIGGLAVFATQLHGREDINEEAELAITSLTLRFDEALVVPVASLRTRANDGRIAALAQDNITDPEQLTSLTVPMQNLVTSNPDYLSARFVTFGGEQRALVTNQITGIPEIDLEPQISPMINDPLFITISTGVNTSSVYLGPLEPPTTAFPEGRISLYAPVAPLGSQPVGVLQLNIAATPILTILQEAINDPLIAAEGRRVALVNADNRLLISFGDEHNDDTLQEFLAEHPGEFINGFNNFRYLITTGNVADYLGTDTPWRLVLEDDFFGVMGETNIISFGLIVAVIFLMTVTLFALSNLLRPVVRPLKEVAYSAQTIAKGGTMPPINDGSEVGRISQSISKMSSQIDTLNRQMTVKDRRHARNFEVLSRIGRQIGGIHDFEALLLRSSELICTELPFYHVQIYLMDDLGQNAVRIYAYGAESHSPRKIQTDDTQPIARVIYLERLLLMDEVRDHDDSPPESRSRLILPLSVGEMVIGALDLHSKQQDAIDDDDVPAFLVLADQLASALYHARIVIDSQRRIERLDDLSRQLTRSAWADDTAKRQGYRYDLMNVEKIDDTEDDDTSGLSSMITIRGEPIGRLVAGGQEFTEGDEMVIRAVADRVALAIENARLFQRTQSTLMETSTLYDLSRSLNKAETLEEIIEAMIISVMTDAIGGQVWLFDDYHTQQGPGWAEVKADYAMNERQENNEDISGLRVHLPDYNFMKTLSPETVTLIQNVREDTRLDAGLKLVCRRVNAEALVCIPYVIRGIWRGFITIDFPEPRVFNEQEGRVYSNLIDQSGVAIDNRLLLRQTEDALTLQENLYAASRIITQAPDDRDLVYAAVATAENHELDFSIAILEGDIDETGWPTRARTTAKSEGGMVSAADEVYAIEIAPDSPMRGREPELIHDDTPLNKNVAVPVRWTRERGYRFTAVFPLFSANQPIALFYVHSQEDYELTSSEYEAYRAMTGQMSTQLEIRRQTERTEQALDETRRLYVASSAIVGAVDSEAVYATATEHLARPFLQINAREPQSLTIALLMATPEATPYAPFFECVHTWQSNPLQAQIFQAGQTLKASDYPYGALTENDHGELYVPDTADADAVLDAYPDLQQKLIDNDISSMYVVPIQSRLKWFGVMVCYSSGIDSFKEQYQRFARALIEQVAVAVDNKRLFEEAQWEAQRAQSEAQRAIALAEAAQLASQVEGDFDQSLNDVFERVALAAGFNRWMLMLFDDRRENLKTIITMLPGYEGDNSLPFDITQDTPIADAAFMGRALLVNDMSSYPRFSESDDPQKQMLIVFFGKHVAIPIITGDRILGSLLMGRDLDTEDLDERDEELAETLAVQVAIALENRRLFDQAQNERQRLQSVLATLPVGVLVIDPKTMRPILHNEQAEVYFGQEIEQATPFSIDNYYLHRTGTELPYPEEEMPVFIALNRDETAVSDDVAVIRDGNKIDLQFNAAPVHNSDGDITAVVVAFQDISSLRSMENTLQDNLRQTVTLYEAQVQFGEAEELDELLDVIIMQFMLFQPDDVFIVQPDEQNRLKVERYHLDDPGEMGDLQELFHPHYIVNIHNVAESNLPPVTARQLARLNAESILTIPLRTRQRPEGWIVMVSSTPDRVESDQEPVLTQLSDAAATAVDNRFLIQSQERSVEQIGALYNATANISRTRDMRQLTAVLEGALQTLRPQYAATYIAGIDSPILFNFAESGTPLALDDLLTTHRIPDDGLFIEDLHDISVPTPIEAALREYSDLRSIAIMNLRVNEGEGGQIVVGYNEPHYFGDDEDRYLNTIIDGASVVVDNILLFEQTQSTLEETTVLYQASRALTDAGDAASIVDVVVNYLIEPHISQVFVALLNGRSWDRPNVTIDIGADWHADEESGLQLSGLVLTEDQFPAWNLLKSPEVVSIDDIDRDDTMDDVTRMGVESMDVRSLVVIPLRVAKRDIGAVWLGSSEPYPHSVRDLRLYQAFAEQASLSMEAAYLLSQTERRARQLETSAEVSSRAGNILDLEVLLPEVVNLIMDSFGYDHVQIFLMDARDDYAELRASTGEAGQKLLGIKHKLQKGSASVIGQVTERGEPQIALDTADADVVHKPNPYLPLTRSEMALPLILKGQVIGALDVQSNQANAFTEDDIAALRVLAAQISVAIDNANLYQSTQSQAERMGFLFNVTRGAAAAETLSETLEGVVRMIYDSYNALSTTIYLRRTYIDEATGNKLYRMKAAAIAGSDQPISEIEEIALDDPDNIISTVAQYAQPYVIDTIADEPRYLAISGGAHAAILVPLRTGGETIGLLVMEDRMTYAYDDDTVRLLEALAGSVGAIVQSSQLLEQLTQTNEQLRELDRIKSDFLANMSHELRTPLNSIIGFSRVMLKGIDGDLTEMQEQDLTTIYNSGQHLLMLINDLLDQAKIAAGKLDIRYAYFDVKPLIEAVKSIGVGLVKDKPVNLITEIAPNLPQAYGDEFRVRQVLINLVSNASKFTEEGEVVIRVYKAEDADTGKGFIRFDVSDTGIGISEKDMPLLFEAFRQVDSSLTRTVGGTGLGLPIAKSLVEMQGGVMTVASEVNVGSTFSVTIPLEPTVDLDDDAETDEDGNVIQAADMFGNEDTKPQVETRPTIEVRKVTQTQPAMAVMPQKRDVLLIEDDKNMVNQYRRILQREGFEVQTADHPSYAEAMVSNLRPSVVMMDVNFADGKGWDILTSLKERDDTFDIPVVIATLDADSERAFRLGAHGFLQRPFMPDQLAEVVLSAEKESSAERILIIDDQPESIRLLTEALNASGDYRVFAAETGREGISLVARRRPNLIILDLRMPEMDGFAVLQELRSNPETANIPVMVVTGELDLNADEKQILENIHILHKTDISQEEYDQFIHDVQGHLNQNGN